MNFPYNFFEIWLVLLPSKTSNGKHLNFSAALVKAIIAAPGSDKNWEDLLRLLMQQTRSSAATLNTEYLDTKTNSFAAAVHMDPALLARYSDYYVHINPWMSEKPELLFEGSVVTSRMLIADSKMLKTEFCDGWAKPQDVFHMLGAAIYKQDPLICTLTLFRPRRYAPFGKELSDLRCLLPHLQGAIQTHRRILVLQADLRAIQSANNSVQVPIVVCQGLTVKFVNRAAREILENSSCMKIVNNRFTVENPAKEHALTSALLRMTASEIEVPPMIIDGFAGHGQTRLEMLMVQSECKRESGAGVVTIFLIDPTFHPRLLKASKAYERWGLTKTETEVLLLLAQGLHVSEIAMKLFVSANTVNSHIKHLYRKVGVRSQSQLCREFFSRAFCSPIE